MEPASYVLKHYKDGDFHKDYDRRETIQSMSTFLRDPSGDIPWDEDEQGVDVVHINDVNVSACGKGGGGRVETCFFSMGIGREGKLSMRERREETAAGREGGREAGRESTG